MTRQTTEKPWRAFTCRHSRGSTLSFPSLVSLRFNRFIPVWTPRASRMHGTACAPWPDEELSGLRWWVTNHSSDSPPPCCLFPLMPFSNSIGLCSAVVISAQPNVEADVEGEIQSRTGLYLKTLLYLSAPDYIYCSCGVSHHPPALSIQAPTAASIHWLLLISNTYIHTYIQTHSLTLVLESVSVSECIKQSILIM